MGTLTNKEKADYLDKLELELRRNYVDKNEATAVLRLKGFYDSSNKKAKKINNYNMLDVYLKDNCAVDCKYFVVKRS